MKFLQRLTQRLTVACCFMAASLSHAADAGPDELARAAINEVLQVAERDPAIQAGDRQRIMEVAEQKILPHFDFELMTQYAVGKHWRQATPEQRQTLVGLFRTLLVRTYTAALTAGDYQKKKYDLVVRPQRGQASADDTTVKVEIKRPEADPILVDLSMAKKNDTWKVYDVAVGGVSLVTTYRSAFGQEIRQSGIDGLIASLERKTRSSNPAAGAPASPSTR